MSDEALDDDLIRAARAGHDYASAFLVSRFGPRLLGHCRDLAPDLSDVDCEHIVEIAIETAVRRIDRFDRDRGKFGSWLRGFVLNAVRDWRRSHARLDSLDDDDRRAPEPATDALGGLLSEVANTTGPDDDAGARLAPVLEAVSEALPKMRPNDQVIIALRDIEGRSIEATAASLKITPDACRQRHHRAKKRLRDMLRDDPRCAFVLPGEKA